MYTTTTGAIVYMSEYSDLMDELSLETSKFITETIELDDEREGADTVIGKDVRRVLDRNKINYIVNPNRLHHPKALNNAVLDGIYHEAYDVNKARKGSKKIKIIYDDTLNRDTDVDIYVVPNEELAESMESAGLTVARYPNQILDLLGKK